MLHMHMHSDRVIQQAHLADHEWECIYHCLYRGISACNLKTLFLACSTVVFSEEANVGSSL